MHNFLWETMFLTLDCNRMNDKVIGDSLREAYQRMVGEHEAISSANNQSRLFKKSLV